MDFLSEKKKNRIERIWR